MLTILISGDREWTDYSKIREALADILYLYGYYDEEISEFDRELVSKRVILVHGDCRGADKLGAEVAKELGISQIHAYPANWSLGKKAGVLRNQEMLDKEKVNIVLAFHSDIELSKGTKDMIFRANKAGIPVNLYS